MEDHRDNQMMRREGARTKDKDRSVPVSDQGRDGSDGSAAAAGESELQRRVVSSWEPTVLESGEKLQLPHRNQVQQYRRIVEAYQGKKNVKALSNKEETLNLGNVVYTRTAGLASKTPMTRQPRPVESEGEDASFPYREDTDQIVISLIGAGMGDMRTITIVAKEELDRAEYVYGSERLIEKIPKEQNPKPYYLAKDILPDLQTITEGRVAVLFSGDTGFYSGCRLLLQELWNSGYRKIQLFPGISSVSYLASVCGVGWQDAGILSIHGKGKPDNWGPEVMECIRYHEMTFLLVSGPQQIRQLGVLLEEQELEECLIIAGSELSYPEEKLLQLTVDECKKLQGEGLYTCLIRNPNPLSRPVFRGFADEEFLRSAGNSSAQQDMDEGRDGPSDRRHVKKEKIDSSGIVPMTKEEVRAAVISKLHLTENAVVYDIGSGTGSVAVEIAAQSALLRVYAIEKRPQAVELIEENCRKHHTTNVEIIAGSAPEVLEWMEAPTHVFIGGSGGSLKEILSNIYSKSPNARVVITAASLETLAELSEIENEYEVGSFELVQMQTSRMKKAGNYHMMKAENPVYIASFTFCGEG